MCEESACHSDIASARNREFRLKERLVWKWGGNKCLQPDIAEDPFLSWFEIFILNGITIAYNSDLKAPRNY
jgi:hypothetical protein